VLTSRGLQPHTVKDTRLVPIPTNGVFAEAVLGRSNSAEKLDITRFWNWQDSPAPLTPPELGPISTGSRALAENLTPGQLGPSTLNIVNPTNLPDPTGLGASLGALANLNFRDMSGLAGTQQLAGTATTGTLTATTEAGKIDVAMAQVAADIVKTAMVTGFGNKKEGGVSGEGARINHGRDLDERKGTGTAGGGEGGGAGSGGGGATTATGTDDGSGGGGAGSTGGGGGGDGASPGYEANAFNESAGTPLGDAMSHALTSLFGGKTSPASTPSSKLDRPTAIAQATTLINAFRSRTTAGKWHQTLTRADVADRLLTLISNPSDLNQSANGLCGEAAFFNVWLWEDPLAVARFAVQLYNSGAAAVGTDVWVRPRSTLLTQDWSKVITMMKDPGAKFRSAEWMMMSALRDANNRWFSYDGTPREQWGDGSSNGEVADWLRATNLFKSVTVKDGGSEEHNWDHASKLIPGNDIILIACDSHMLGNPAPSGGAEDDHWFVLRSGITEKNGVVDFRFWCWGEPIQWVNDRRNDPSHFDATNPMPGDLHKQQFTDDYFGYLIAKR
jgi:hypothetical protein